MPTATGSDLHVSVPLSNISIAYFQNPVGFVASRVFPNIPVQRQYDKYYTYNRSDFNRLAMRERAPGAESSGSGFRVDAEKEYRCKVYSVHKDIHERDRANADSVLNLDGDATRWAAQQALLLRETKFADEFLAPNVWSNNRTGVASSPGANQVLQWSDDASTPIEDVRLARRTVMQTTGYRPNKIVLCSDVYDVLLDHPEVIERINRGQTPGGPATAGADHLSRLFEMEVLVMDSIINLAPEGRAEDSQFIGSKRALLVYAPPSPGLMVPSAGYTFSWTGYLGAGAEGTRAKSIPMPWLEVQRIEVDMAMQQKLVAPDLGFLFSSIIA